MKDRLPIGCELQRRINPDAIALSAEVAVLNIMGSAETRGAGGSIE